MGLELGLIPLLLSKREENETESKRTVNGAFERSNSHQIAYDVQTSDLHKTCASSSFAPTESLIRLTNSTTSPVVIGRRQLLTSFDTAYTVHELAGRDKEKIPHRETLRWGVKSLSREMLRFSDAGMQIRGKHAVVKVNKSEISTECSTGKNSYSDESGQSSTKNQTSKGEQMVGWSTNPVKIRPGDILSLEPREGQGLLEFSVLELNQMMKDEIVPNATSFDMEKSGADENGTKKSSEWPGQGEECNKDGIIANSRQVAFSDSIAKRNLNTTNTLIRKKSIEAIKASFLVYFFPFGNGFSMTRRQKLEHNLRVLGAVIVDDLLKANYIVISESIRSLELVARRMRVPEEQLVRYLESNDNIRCVLPSWADHCISAVKCLVVPSRIHVWCYSRTSTTTRSISPKNLSRKRSKDAINDLLRDFDEKSKNQKKTFYNYNAIQTKRQCRFRRNLQVAEAFKKLSDLHESMSLIPADTWKSYCFRIVAGRLLQLDFEISNDEDTIKRLRSIKGFGKGVCEKIQECIEYGTMSRIQEFQSDPRRQAMKNLKSIWGVGTVRASDLIDRGYSTIDDVRIGIHQNKLLLDRNQLVGVECYEDILDRMSRPEVEKIGESVRLAAERLFPGIETSIMGSYRRGKESCGDVDIQLTHPAFLRNIPTDALGRIIDVLWNEGKIAMHLTFLHGMTRGSHYTDYVRASRHVPKDAWERTKTISRQTEHKFYMGCLYSPIKPSVRRRVDIKFYPYRERAFASLYFTGNGYFNRSMRLWATRVFGFKLSDHGLFDRGSGTTRVFEASTEREIFDRLHLVYREPNERHCWDALEPIDKSIEPDFGLTESELKRDRNNQWVE